MVAGVTAENRKTIPDDSIIFGSIEKQHSLLKKKKISLKELVQIRVKLDIAGPVSLSVSATSPSKLCRMPFTCLICV